MEDDTDQASEQTWSFEYIKAFGYPGPGEETRLYKIKWSGIDGETGKPWEDTWEPGENIDPESRAAFDKQWEKRVVRKVKARRDGKWYLVSWMPRDGYIFDNTWELENFIEPKAISEFEARLLEKKLKEKDGLKLDPSDSKVVELPPKSKPRTGNVGTQPNTPIASPKFPSIPKRSAISEVQGSKKPKKKSRPPTPVRSAPEQPASRRNSAEKSKSGMQKIKEESPEPELPPSTTEARTQRAPPEVSAVGLESPIRPGKRKRLLLDLSDEESDKGAVLRSKSSSVEPAPGAEVSSKSSNVERATEGTVSSKTADEDRRKGAKPNGSNGKNVGEQREVEAEGNNNSENRIVDSTSVTTPSQPTDNDIGATTSHLTPEGDLSVPMDIDMFPEPAPQYEESSESEWEDDPVPVIRKLSAREIRAELSPSGLLRKWTGVEFVWSRTMEWESY
ncbi:hypothetical protein M427DRAFT_33815 [Gonapodya prolifera JEL478]|uniref:Chromo domain-containing protein n=1 Tax=Gonapodya prolifera (strain JEL478) TaxID=1344416 RepID=A0A139AB63_GONPJ|nr:hypothetical protein M427DRAFT_33815 [Gonapodya prolifera JEL478]|eukprot:KXS13633.1 hypothetical protein M427DRAFT_33815 [Gonapodya prolifera JEL478]